MTYRIAAGIILYNPDVERLRDNLSAIINQVEEVVLINNGIAESEREVQDLLNIYHNVSMINNDENKGVAFALNQMCKWAQQKGFEWILTLDQDSVCDTDMIQKFIDSGYVNIPNVGIICPKIEFIKNGLKLFSTDKVQDSGDQSTLEACITSGSLTRIEAWNTVNGFDDWMFIDHVDNDFCRKLINSGYRILRVAQTSLYQQAGEMNYRIGRKGKITMITNYSPLRNYYIVRNTVYYIRKHKKIIPVFREIGRLMIILMKKLLYEKNKFKTISTAFKGLRDGMRKKIITR